MSDRIIVSRPSGAWGTKHQWALGHGNGANGSSTDSTDRATSFLISSDGVRLDRFPRASVALVALGTAEVLRRPLGRRAHRGMVRTRSSHGVVASVDRRCRA